MKTLKKITSIRDDISEQQNSFLNLDDINLIIDFC